jgi:hypothetical protein
VTTERLPESPKIAELEGQKLFAADYADSR